MDSHCRYFIKICPACTVKNIVQKQKIVTRWHGRGWEQKLLPDAFLPAPATLENDKNDDGNDVDDQEEADANT